MLFKWIAAKSGTKYGVLIIYYLVNYEYIKMEPVGIMLITLTGFLLILNWLFVVVEETLVLNFGIEDVVSDAVEE